MLHHSSSAVALEIWWPSAARHLKYDDQVPCGTWNVLIKCHGTWLSYFKCRAALDHHISSAAWHLVIIFQVPRGTWSSYFKCHGTWWMMQHYYVLYTYMVNTNQKCLNTLRQSVQKVLNTLPQLNTKGQKGPQLEPLSWLHFRGPFWQKGPQNKT